MSRRYAWVRSSEYGIEAGVWESAVKGDPADDVLEMIENEFDRWMEDQDATGEIVNGEGGLTEFFFVPFEELTVAAEVTEDITWSALVKLVKRSWQDDDPAWRTARNFTSEWSVSGYYVQTTPVENID